MEEKFTPGPWETESKCAECGVFFRYAFQVVAPALNKRVCYCETDNQANIEVLDANAELIAAAPDMYHALQMLVGVLDDCRRGTDEGNIPPGILDRFDEATNVCRAALKKARGEA